LEREGRAAGISPRNETSPLVTWLSVTLLLWLAFYVPVGFLWLTGWRPPWDWLQEFLIVLFGVHSAVLLLGGGLAWTGRVWHRWTNRRLFAAARNLEQLLSLPPADFESWTATLFERYSYQVRNMPNSADHGVDLIVTSPDGETGIVQCKRYRGTVGEPVVRDLYGTMVHVGADRGFLVTTGAVSRSARSWAEGKTLELIDGATLLRLAE
jgi:restriction system protein